MYKNDIKRNLEKALIEIKSQFTHPSVNSGTIDTVEKRLVLNALANTVEDCLDYLQKLENWENRK